MRASLREVQSGDLPRLDDLTQVFDLFGRDDPASLNLEKSWHGLHRLLETAGTAPELGFLLGGGTEVGAQLSYSRPRLLDAGFVRRLDAALRGISDDHLWAGFDAQEFETEGIYPGIWDEPADELREEYVGYFREVREFVGRVAAASGQVLVVIM